MNERNPSMIGDCSAGEIATAVMRYGEATSPLQMNVRDAECLSVALAQQSSRDVAPFDLVVGIANGALLPTKVIAGTLQLPFEIVRVRRKGSAYKQRLLKLKDALHLPTAELRWGLLKPIIDLFQNLTGKLEEVPGLIGFDVTGKRVLLVDDCVVTGATLAYVANRLIEAGATETVTSVLCWGEVPRRDIPQPNVYLHRQIHVYPWSGDSHSLQDFKTWLAANQLALWQ